MPSLDTGSTLLTKDDGTALADNDVPGRGEFRLPPGDDWYRLKINAHRDSGPELGSRWPMSDTITDEWRFRSGHMTDNRPRAEKLLDIRYGLPLCGLEKVAVGKPFTFQVSVARQNGSTGGPVREVGAEYSVDGGKTCVAADGDRWAVALPALAQALRTHAVATDGSEVLVRLATWPVRPYLRESFPWQLRRIHSPQAAGVKRATRPPPR